MAAITVGDRVDRLSGMYDAGLASLKPDYLADYYADCFVERKGDASVRAFGVDAEAPWPERALEHATVNSQYISVYRIHSKDHFLSGFNFPANWADSERKAQAQERFSPVGAVGHYFGLTLDAALDEACFYGDGSIDVRRRMILVLECSFDNLLYLTVQSALQAAWELVGLPPVSLMEMYLRIMDPETGNREADAIGAWARSHGFDGVIFPSARYGQREDLERARAAGREPIPVMNTVFIGSHLCVQGLATWGFKNVLVAHLQQTGAGKRFHPVYAEPNLVLFDGSQIGGKNRAVFYQTFPLDMAKEVEDLDPRLKSKSYTHFVEKDGAVTIVEQGPDFSSFTNL